MLSGYSNQISVKYESAVIFIHIAHCHKSQNFLTGLC